MPGDLPFGRAVFQHIKNQNPYGAAEQGSACDQVCVANGKRAQSVEYIIRTGDLETVFNKNGTVSLRPDAVSSEFVKPQTTILRRLNRLLRGRTSGGP